MDVVPYYGNLVDFLTDVKAGGNVYEPKPKYQRPLNEDHVVNMVDTIREYIQKHEGKIPVLGVISVCHYPIAHSNKRMYVVIDGQHRLTALEILQQAGINVPFNVMYIDVDDDDDCFDQFRLHNMALNHDNYMAEEANQQKQILLNDIKDWLVSFNTLNAEDDKIFLNNEITKPCKRPAINVSIFVNNFVKSDYYKICNDLDCFKTIFEDLNQRLGNILTALRTHKTPLVASSQRKIEDSNVLFRYLFDGEYFTYLHPEMDFGMDVDTE